MWTIRVLLKMVDLVVGTIGLVVLIALGMWLLDVLGLVDLG